MFIPVIMAGGSGTRLWPLSRRMMPKQFLPLAGEHSMLQDTILRLNGLARAPAIVICNEEHRFFVATQLQEIKETENTIILEPSGRNTAPAIAATALYALKHDDDPTMLILTADHIVTQLPVFHQTINEAEQLAQRGKLVTFGIVPNRPETGYGYIRCGEAVGAGFEVDKFVEKPDLSLAQKYLDSGKYYWNSGIFMFQAARYLEELERFNPKIIEACRKSVENGREDADFFRLEKKDFTSCPSDSIDYAVMEKTESAAVIPLDAGWNDVGSWSALWDISKKDKFNNAVHGDAMLLDTQNSLIRAESRLVTTVGLDNVVVVETRDAVLVADKSKSQDLKQIVDHLREKERLEEQYHRVVHRPWGHFDTLDESERFKVKRITVKPGERLSVQMHHHRSEHWIVVSGTAKVTRGKKSYLITENESVYIHVGEMHSLENPGVIPLELIEVQTGSCLSEDDIVRFDDRYGRNVAGVHSGTGEANS